MLAQVRGSDIHCGGCNCQYNPMDYNGCPQCGFGASKLTYTTTTTPDRGVVYYIADDLSTTTNYIA